MHTPSTSQPGQAQARLLISCLGLLALFTNPSRAVDDCWAVHSRASLPAEGFTVFAHVRDDSTIANPMNYLYPTGDGVYGAAFKDGTFHGIERESSSGSYKLVTIPLVGLAYRVQIGATGFPDVEALACVENELIAASLDYTPPHHTDFISINSTTGAGTLIGAGSMDVMIVGLAYDPISGKLYGAGMPYTTVSGYNLYEINPATGATAFIGNIGHPVQSLTVSPSLGLVGAMGNLISINPATGAGTVIGASDYTLGYGVGPGIFNGLYALASEPPAAAATVTILSAGLTPAGDFEMTWASESGCSYQVETSSTLVAGSWSPFGSSMPGTPPSMSMSTAVTSGPTFFRIVKSTP